MELVVRNLVCNYHFGKFMLCKGATRQIIPDNKVLLDQTLTSLQ